MHINTNVREMVPFIQEISNIMKKEADNKIKPSRETPMTISNTLATYTMSVHRYVVNDMEKAHQIVPSGTGEDCFNFVSF